VERRRFLQFVGLGLAMPIAAAQSQGRRKIPRLGILWHAGSEEQEREYFTVLMQAFRDLGYVDGSTAEFLHRYPAEQPDKFRQFAHELVNGKVDVILSVTIRGTMVLKELNSSIPVVFVLAADPVGSHLVESLARPGSNMTGLSLMSEDLSGKRVAILKEAIPTLSRLAFLMDPSDPNSMQPVGARSTAQRLSIAFADVPVAGPDEIEPTFARLAAEGFGAALVGGSMFFNERARVGQAASNSRIPTMSFIAEMVPYGLLMTYGPDFVEFFRLSAGLADKILKGTRPAEIPVEQPTRIKQVINLKVARALNLTIPTSLLIASDVVLD
jgi:putative ABC transport system substrate-binding protein